jgi:hypothetical protein
MQTVCAKKDPGCPGSKSGRIAAAARLGQGLVGFAESAFTIERPIAARRDRGAFAFASWNRNSKKFVLAPRQTACKSAGRQGPCQRSLELSMTGERFALILETCGWWAAVAIGIAMILVIPHVL